MKINQAVTYYRELCGMSEYKLGERTNIHRASLNRLCNNEECNPTMLTLEVICRALNMKVSDLIIKAEELDIKEQCAEFGITLREEK